MSIIASRALYVKLGEGGRWEKTSIENNEIRLGFQEIPHEVCFNHNWDEATEIEKQYCKSQGALTSQINQVKEFYTADEDVMWITFYAGKMWWCFASKEFQGFENGEKIRKVKGKWHDTAIDNNVLWKRGISGKLLKTEKFMGTICKVSEFSYLTHKVNGTVAPQIQVAKEAYQALQSALIPIIKNLHEFDFEIFVDLIFRQSGWQRVGVSGGTEKDIDLDLVSPATGDRIAVQIKSVADLEVWLDYKQRLSEYSGFSRFYFVTHTASPALLGQATSETNANLVLWDEKELASQTVRGGLTGWLLDKAS